MLLHSNRENMKKAGGSGREEQQLKGRVSCGRHVVIFFVASRVFHSFRDHDRADFEGSALFGRESRAIDVGGEPKVVDFWHLPKF